MAETDEQLVEQGFCGQIKPNGEPCELPAGWGTEHVGRAGCRYHSNWGGQPGNDNAIGNEGGAPLGNQNATTHGLHAEPSNYVAHLNEADREWVAEMTELISDRVRRTKLLGKLDSVDQTFARQLAAKLHIAAHATGHLLETGLVQRPRCNDASSNHRKEVVNPLFRELRYFDREIVEEMRRYGLLETEQNTAQVDVTEALSSSDYELIIEDRTERSGEAEWAARR